MTIAITGSVYNGVADFYELRNGSPVGSRVQCTGRVTGANGKAVIIIEHKSVCLIGSSGTPSGDCASPLTASIDEDGTVLRVAADTDPSKPLILRRP